MYYQSKYTKNKHIICVYHHLSPMKWQHSGDEKYILCHLKSRNQGDDEGQYVLVSYPLPYHSDIAKAYKQTLDDNCEVRVLGGTFCFQLFSILMCA